MSQCLPGCGNNGPLAKYSEPAADADGYSSSLGLLTSGPSLMGSLQPSGVRSTIQRSMSSRVTPSTGRIDEKYSRCPLGAMNGSMSLYTPENDATTGVVHSPLTRWVS